MGGTSPLLANRKISPDCVFAGTCSLLNIVITPVVATLTRTMRTEIPQGVAALLEELDRRIEESQTLRVELSAKMAERDAAEQCLDEGTGANKSTQRCSQRD